YINSHAAGQTEVTAAGTSSPVPAGSATPGAAGEANATGEASPSASPADAAASPAPDGSGTPATRAAAEAPPLHLQVTATTASCWINVKTDDGNEVRKTLQLGETEEFVASDKIELHLGNVIAVSATLNGRPMKLAPTRSKTVLEDVITKENYQKFIQ